MLQKMTAREFTTWSIFHRIKAENEKRQTLNSDVMNRLEERRARRKAKS